MPTEVPVGDSDGVSVGETDGELVGVSVGERVGEAVGCPVGVSVGGKDGGAVKLEVPGNVLLQRSSISCWVNVKETRSRIVNWLTPGSAVWSLLPVPGLQTSPQALPPEIVASPSGPSALRKFG